MNNRAGIFMDNTNGYQCFIPKPLPPEPPVMIDPEMQNLLSIADRKLGRLDGVTEILPDPELFIAMYVKKEALLSSQIEGTQASLVDVLEFDADLDVTEKRNHVEEVVNYVAAMNYGLRELEHFPLSLRLIRNIHAELLKGVRGCHRNPGEFRTSQNWIGPAGCTLSTATFVPPSVPEMNKAMGDLELFFYDESHYIPALIKIAMIHAQFETIHPFLDGNGRMGRLLITFWLCQQKILNQPLLYLSYYFKRNRTEYYDRLMDVRKKGKWENWIKFFLKGVAEVSDESTKSAKDIIGLKTNLSQMLLSVNGGIANNEQKLLDLLFTEPIITRKQVEQMLKVSNPTAGSLLDKFSAMSILQDITPDRTRNKKYIFADYISILERGTELDHSTDLISNTY